MPRVKYSTTGGDAVKGVTTIIGSNVGWNKGALIGGARKAVGQKNRGETIYEFWEEWNYAATVGTVMHAIAEADLRGTGGPIAPPLPPKFQEQVARATAAWRQWNSTVKLEPEAIELSLVCDHCHFGGTLDLVAQLNGKRTLIDFKTASGIYEDNLPQLAAYGHLWHVHNPSAPLEAFAIARLDKDSGQPEVRVWEATELVPAWEVFVLAQRLESYHDKLKGLVA